MLHLTAMLLSVWDLQIPVLKARVNHLPHINFFCVRFYSDNMKLIFEFIDIRSNITWPVEVTNNRELGRSLYHRSTRKDVWVIGSTHDIEAASFTRGLVAQLREHEVTYWIDSGQLEPVIPSPAR